jgi:hypothetical protein
MNYGGYYKKQGKKIKDILVARAARYKRKNY